MDKRKSYPNIIKSIAFLLAFILVFSNSMLIGLANPEMNSISNSDIKGHWAEEIINKWISQGLVSGYEDGTFRPNRNIKRAEFIAIINGAINLLESEEVGFNDVNEADWFYSEIGKAVKAGYISGYDDNTVKPYNQISREEAAVIIGKILKPKGVNTDEVLNIFNDSAQVADWSKSFLASVTKNGYMSGYPDNTIKPKKAITRAETIVMLNRVIGTLFNKSGVYGPEKDIEIIEGNVTVSEKDIILQNMEIKGSLYLTEGIGEGDIELDNVIVKGSTLIKGGGENSIIFNNTTLKEVIVYKSNGKIRVVARGNTNITKATIESGANIQEEHLEGNGFGDVQVMVVKPGETLELKGDFESVSVETKVEVKVTGETKVKNLNIEETANGTKLDMEKGTSIDTLTLETKTTVTGKGKITQAEVNAEGVKIEQKPDNILVAKGVEANVAKETVTESSSQSESDSDSSSRSGSSSGGSSGGGTTLKNISSVEKLEDIIVECNTNFEDIDLPDIVKVTLDDNSTINLNVTWNENGYNSEAGTYSISGTLELVSGIKNTYNRKATINVVVNDEPTVIDVTAIPGVTAPVKGQVPKTTMTETSQYTGTVTWSPDHNPFQANTVYTATITLTPKEGYTLTGLEENIFTVGGVSATNEADSGVVTAVFPETEAQEPAPSQTNLTPLNNATKVALDTAVSIEFAGYVTENDLSGITIEGILEGTVGNVSAALAEDNRTININHDAFTNYNEIYTVTIPADAVRNSDGIGNAEIIWSFTTDMPPTYTISLDADDPTDLGTVMKGYASETPTEVTITRTGTGDISNLSVALSGDNEDDFTVTQPSDTTLNDETTSTKFTVVPKDGLQVGNYTATVIVTADNGISETFAVEFEVKVAAYTLTLQASPETGGSVKDNTNAGPYLMNQPVNVTATANPGYEFVNWSHDGMPMGFSPTFNFNMVPCNATLVANFQPLEPTTLGISITPGSIVVNIDSINDNNGDLITFANAQSIYGLNIESSEVVLNDGTNTITLNLDHEAFIIDTASNPETITINTNHSVFDGFDTTQFNGSEYIKVTIKGNFAGQDWEITDQVTGMDNIAVDIARKVLEGAAQEAFDGITQANNVKAIAQMIVDDQVAGVTVLINSSSQTGVVAIDGSIGSGGTSNVVFGLEKGSDSSETGSVEITVSDTIINIAAIEGVTAPVRGEAPVTIITETEQYTGTIVWNPDDNPFGAETIYTATINLTAKEGFTLTGVSENFFTISGATSVANGANSGVITAIFPETEAVPIVSATINPTTGIFDKKVETQADVTTDITWNSATQVTAVKKGVDTLVDNTDYAVADNTLTIKKEYLASQTEGDVILTVEFDKGDSKTLTITVSDTTPQQLTISDPVVTQSKIYDKTIEASVTAGVLSGVESGDEVSVTAEASYDTAKVGTNKTITVVYTLGGTDVASYVKPENYTVNIGEITAKQLSISDPVVTASKEYDGTISAAVTAGVLSGVESGDEVTVSAEASYDTAEIGTNKTIKVVYILGGADAANYIKPVDYTVTTGEITAKPDTVINIAAIGGVTVPVRGQAPVTTITETEQYTGTIVWNPDDNPFGAETIYTVTITLTAKEGFTLTGVSENFFTISGATSVANGANSGVITAVFPETEAALKYTVTFTVTDGSDPITAATITINNKTLTTDAGGSTSVDLENGTYPYSVIADGFNDITGDSVTVSDEAVGETVTMTLKPVPQAASFTPVKDSTVPVNTLVAIVFDCDINVNDLSGVTISGTTEGLVGNVVATLAEDNRTVNIAHDAFKNNNELYTVAISANAVSSQTEGTVNPEISWSFTTLEPGAEITINSILQLDVNETATATTIEAGAGGWTSSNSSVATIDANTGVITAKGEGLTTISYTTSTSGKVNHYEIEIFSEPADYSSDLVFEDSTTTISSGTKQLTGFPDQINEGEEITFTIKDGSTDVITVNNNGLVSYIADGTKTIRYEMVEVATNLILEFGEVQITAEPAPAPTVNFTTPQDDAVVSIDITNTVIQFNQNVTEVDLSGVTIICLFHGSDVPVGNVTASVDSQDSRTVNITHDSLPYNSNLYTVTIPAGAVQNAEGTVNEEVTWSFRTGPIVTPKSITFSNTDSSVTITVEELYNAAGNNELGNFVNDTKQFDINFRSGDDSYPVDIDKAAGSADIVITNPSVIKKASDSFYDIAIYTDDGDSFWGISLVVTSDPQIEFSPETPATFSKQASSAQFSVATLVDNLGKDAQFDLLQDDGTDFSYELTDGTNNVTVTNNSSSSYLQIATPAQAVDTGTYILTITRNSDGIEWTKEIIVTE